MPSARTISRPSSPRHVSLVVAPEVTASTLSGMYDVLNCFEFLGKFDEALPSSAPFRVECVSTGRGRVVTASGLPLDVHRALEDVTSTDIVMVPSLLVERGEWVPGRHAEAGFRA